MKTTMKLPRMTESLIERSSIEVNKQYKRLNEKTQVLVPQNGLEEVTQSRLTHSYEVATSSLMVASSVAEALGLNIHDIDYQHSVYNASLLHDIGHPPFGHDGAVLIDDFFFEKGYEEGFSDNNNNLIVIEKNNIKVSDYTKVSVIKYPTKLFDKQKTKYLPLLEVALEEDRKHFAQFGINLNPKYNTQTIACQIMDEADRNTYVCSDLIDFFCLGNEVTLKELKAVSRTMGYEDTIDSYIEEMYEQVKDGNKNKIKEFFNGTTILFNTNHKIDENGLGFNCDTLFRFREFLSKATYVFFISPLRDNEFHKSNMEMLREFLDYVYDEEFYPSKHYGEEIRNSDDEQYKLEMMRDMVSEVSDWYIFKFAKAYATNNVKSLL